MFGKLNFFFSNLKMTVVSSLFLLVSVFFILNDMEPILDPIFGTIIISGFPIIYIAINSLITYKHITSELLITIAMFAAIAIGELFAAGEIALIMMVGTLLEEHTINRAKGNLESLIKLEPKETRLIKNYKRDEEEEIISTDKIIKGNILRIIPGDIIPVDGRIISGISSIDQSIITGESIPIDKGIGDFVYSGTINCFGSIDIVSTSATYNSSLQKLINMLKIAEDNKAPLQKIVDKLASYIIVFSLLTSVLTYIFTGDIIRAVTILVVFCPCSLALSTPVSIIAAIGQASKFGVLIKSGEALEKMGKANVLAFDKTGTLTYGKLQVTDIISFDDSISKSELLKLVASAEVFSEHPLGKAIVKKAKEDNLKLKKAENFLMTPGKGITVTIDGKSLYCGNKKYLYEHNVEISEQIIINLNSLMEEGKASILISDENKCFGIIAMSDTLKPGIETMVKELESMDTSVILLTGDNIKTARYFSTKSGIKNIKAELLPAEKAFVISQLQEEGNTVCMVGDGVNDALALKTADVSVAMGLSGSGITLEAADITIMNDDIGKITYIKKLSNKTIKTIKYNIAASIYINIIAIILSILGVLNPITGALVHNISSLLIVSNAALLYRRKFK